MALAAPSPLNTLFCRGVGKVNEIKVLNCVISVTVGMSLLANVLFVVGLLLFPT